LSSELSHFTFKVDVCIVFIFISININLLQFVFKISTTVLERFFAFLSKADANVKPLS